MEIEQVALSRIRPEPCTAPKSLDTSVGKYGVLHPLLLEAIDDKKFDFGVVDGRRRRQSAENNKLKQVPAIILPADVCRELVGLSEHYSRSPSPAIEAEYFAALISGGMTQTELAVALGISQGKISQRLALREKLIPELFEMLRKGDLIATVAREITSLDSFSQRSLLKQAMKGQRLTIKYLNGLKREKMMSTLELVPIPEVPQEKKDAIKVDNAYIKELSDRYVKVCGIGQWSTYRFADWIIESHYETARDILKQVLETALEGDRR